MTEPTPGPEFGAETPPAEESTPFWSPWATVGWGAIIVIGFVLVQGAIVVAWSAAVSARGGSVEEVLTDGDLLAVATLCTALLCGALTIVCCRAKPGCHPVSALALTRPRPVELARWLAITAALIVTADLVTHLLGRPIVPEFMTEAVATADLRIVFWLAVIVAAPLFEELFVRGFLLEGLRRGPLGDAGAIVLTSLFWASIHVQYEPYELAIIVIFGMALGLARVLGGSLWIPIAMHAFANLVATVEAHLLAPP